MSNNAEHAAAHPAGASNEDDHHDPLHDIDEGKTVLAVVGTLVGAVFVIWIMSHVYSYMVRVEREKKIGGVKPLELQQLRLAEDDELSGKNPNRGARHIDQAIQEYLKR